MVDLAALRTRLYRLFFNWFPAYRSTGAWLTYVDPDWREVRLKLPLTWRTRNYMGTTFGGSMYAAVDPIYAMMLIKALGDDFEVWDRSATIEFEKPGEETLYARFELSDAELDDIRESLDPGEATDRHYSVALVDEAGTTHATVEKTVYVKRRA
jgi:acyl-coenzyme A thioesterase PaaI-like protein